MSTTTVEASDGRQLSRDGSNYDVSDIWEADALVLDSSLAYDGVEQSALLEFDLSSISLTNMADVTFSFQVALNDDSPGMNFKVKGYDPAMPANGSQISVLAVVAGSENTYWNDLFPYTVPVDNWYDLILSSANKANLMTDLIAAKAGSGLFRISFPVNVLPVSGPVRFWQGNSGRGKPKLLLTITVPTGTDPFTLVDLALWQMLEDNTDFASLVKVGNRIKHSEGAPKQHLKEQLTSSDVPEVRIIQTGMTPLINASSCSSMMTMRYDVQVFSGDQRFHVKHNPVTWSIFRALANWKTRLGALVWNNKKFVHLTKPAETAVLLGEDRGIIGWASVWSCEVHLNFATADL